jgi:hypothetical protein
MSRFKCRGTGPPREAVTLSKKKKLSPDVLPAVICGLGITFCRQSLRTVSLFNLCLHNIYNKDYKQQFSSRATTTVIGPNMKYHTVQYTM